MDHEDTCCSAELDNALKFSAGWREAFPIIFFHFLHFAFFLQENIAFLFGARALFFLNSTDLHFAPFPTLPSVLTHNGVGANNFWEKKSNIKEKSSFYYPEKSSWFT